MPYTRHLKSPWLFALAAVLFATIISTPARAQLDSLPTYRYVRLWHADTSLMMYGHEAEVTEDGAVLISNPFVLRGSGTEQFQTPFLPSVWVDGKLYPVYTGNSYEPAIDARWNSNGQIVTGARVINPDLSHLHPILTELGQAPVELELLPKTHHGDPDFPNPPCLWAFATDINDNGVIIGHAREGTNFFVDVERYLVLWDGETPMKLPSPDGIPPADFDHDNKQLFINNNGTIAGTRFIQSSLRIGFYGDRGGLNSIPYGRDSLTQARVLGLGDNDWAIGTMAGKWERPSDNTWITQTHGWVSKDGQTMIDLNNSDTANQSPGIFPNGINSHGVIVGSAGLSWNSAAGVLWREEDGQFVGYGLEDRVVEGSEDIPFSRISGGSDIADNGIILAYTLNGSGYSFPGLLIPTNLDSDNGFCVNTDSDEPDNNPGDGICSTGELNVLGLPECSMRAAIEESNAHTGVDTICFDIPLNRTIYPQSPLPAVTDPVVIDGATQPGGPPHLNGRQQGFGSGLEILAGGSAVWSIMLNDFPSDGLELRNGDGNTIEGCWIGTDTTEIDSLGNGGHGIFIENSSQNRIGDAGALEHANTIAWNGMAGIFVASGEQNTIFTNSFFFNEGLAIDLEPLGVNTNDDNDADSGPNTRLNHAVIDYAQGGYLYGTIDGEPNETMVVELYRSDSAHPTNFGEGREPLLLTTTVDTDGNGIGQIELFLDGESLDEGQVFTMLVHDADNTSEFSAAWPNKTIEVTDHTGNPIPSMSFAMYRIDGGPPDFPETLLDTITTDANGLVDLTEYYLSGELGRTSVIKLRRFMAADTTVRQNATLLPEAIEWHLDNAGFDAETQTMGFDTLDTSAKQEVRMDHTLILLNVYVSIEWEVEPDYVTRLEQAFREGSNYLFDITDGQMALGQVHIVDDKQDWSRADLRILAQNNFRAESKLGGVDSSGNWYMVTSRRWFGSGAAGQVLDIPLNPADYLNVRVIIHEMGHYFMALGDEYEFFRGDRCLDSKLYGFMDHYDNLNRAQPSEMSQAHDYSSPACANTYQWYVHGESCWETFDQRFTRTVDGLELPIVRPVERQLAPDYDFFPGPNDDLEIPDYDIGALLESTLEIAPNSSNTHFMFFENPISGQPTAFNFATLIKPHKVPFKRRQKQGGTSAEGWLQVLGAENGDSLELSGRYTEFITGGTRSASAGVSDYRWSSTRVELNTGSDSQSVAVTEVAGTFPLVCTVTLVDSTTALHLEATSMFSAEPTAIIHSDSGSGSPFTLTAAAAGYSAELPSDMLNEGTIQISAIDDTGAAFFWNVDYVERDSGNTGLGEIRSRHHQFSARIDSNQGALSRTAILSTDYPPPGTGLPQPSQPVSRVHALATAPNGQFAESTVVSIEYNEAVIGDETGLYGSEVSVHVFTWDEANAMWQMLPSIIDTSADIVMAPVGEPGVFAAFTTDINTDVVEIDSDLLPNDWHLAQNYPNPFNPSTTIEYTVPAASHVSLTIHNLLGREVTRLVNENQNAGRYRVIWNGRNSRDTKVASGVYFYRMVADNFTESRKMILLK